MQSIQLRLSQSQAFPQTKSSGLFLRPASMHYANPRMRRKMRRKELTEYEKMKTDRSKILFYAIAVHQFFFGSPAGLHWDVATRLTRQYLDEEPNVRLRGLD